MTPPSTSASRAVSWSLRRRLLWIAALASFASLLFGGVAMYWAASTQEDQMLDAGLELLGGTIQSFVEEELRDDPGNPSTRRQLRTRPAAALLYSYQVWSRDGRLLLRSNEAPEATPLIDIAHRGFATVKINGEEYRVYALPTRTQEYVIQVAESLNESWAKTGANTAFYTASLLIPFSLVFVVTWIMTRRSLSSIVTIADQLVRRNPLDLTPVQVEQPPVELLPVLHSIDGLIARIGRALSAERRFTSVAAHELRTPLAGLRAQAQLAARAPNDEERQIALRSILVGADRASHMLDQLLDLARVEALAGVTESAFERVELEDVFEEVMSDLGPGAARKGVRVEGDLEGAAVHAYRFAVYLLVRNLLSNAIGYSPPGGRVGVSAVSGPDGAVLTIDDSGPGIEAADRERVFERFNRLGRSEPDGVGLGLSIVLSAVELHRWQIRLLDSPHGGLRVQVAFDGLGRSEAGSKQAVAATG